MGQKQFTDRNAKIMARLQSGVPRKVIADEFGMSVNAIIGVIWRMQNPEKYRADRATYCARKKQDRLMRKQGRAA